MMQFHRNLAQWFDSLADEDQQFLDESLHNYEQLTIAEEIRDAQLIRARTMTRIARLRSMSAYHMREYQAARERIQNAE